MLKFEKTIPVGLQLYSVRDALQSDLKGTLKKIKEMGYDYVEHAGFHGLTAKEFRAALDEAGLIAVSAHVSYNDMLNNIDKVVDDCVTIGAKFVALPYLEPAYRPGAEKFDEVVENLSVFGKKFAENGIQLLYHNHDFEFQRMPDGQYAIDYMYETVDASLLATEFDCGWVNVSGENPAEYIRKYAGRCPVVHLKDYTGQRTENMYNLIGLKETSKPSELFQFRPVGYGKLDIPSIIKAATESGTNYFIVEQDSSLDQTPLEAVEMSRKYLKTLGF